MAGETGAGGVAVCGVTGGGGSMAGEAGAGGVAVCGVTGGGGSMAGEAGAGAKPDGPLGGIGETGASGACGTVLGLDGLKTGGGGGGTGMTVCARAWPMAKAAIIAASKTAAKSAAGRSNPVASMPISLSSGGRPNARPAYVVAQSRQSADRGHPRLKISAERKTWAAGT
jgi:hypothetical protein